MSASATTAPTSETIATTSETIATTSETIAPAADIDSVPTEAAVAARTDGTEESFADELIEEVSIDGMCGVY